MDKEVCPAFGMLGSDILTKVADREIEIASGILNSDIMLSPVSSNGLAITGASKIRGARVSFKEKIKPIELDLDQTLDAKIESFSDIRVNKYELDARVQSKEALKLIIDGNYNIHTQKGNVHTFVPYLKGDIASFYRKMPGEDNKFVRC